MHDLEQVMLTLSFVYKVKKMDQDLSEIQKLFYNLYPQNEESKHFLKRKLLISNDFFYAYQYLTKKSNKGFDPSNLNIFISLISQTSYLKYRDHDVKIVN